MRRVVVQTFLSLDGVMQAPGGPEEDPSGGFELGGWSVNFWDDAMGQRMDEALGRPFDLLLGRRTYDIFAAHWPHVTDDPAADALNRATKYVASRSQRQLGWANSVLLRGDVGQEVTRLKEGSGPEIQVHGSGQLIQTLMEHDLVDEYRLWVFPVLLGHGKRLFADGTIPRTLRLLDSATSTTGVVMGIYERAGTVEVGSFALEGPTPEEIERRRRLAEE
ncbi:MAG TPA: dihydrofolate reductase family protein [Actinomycetota bacterium]|nr:dihydrofolate reductase family protein [Actinomycetota bacterium]